MLVLTIVLALAAPAVVTIDEAITERLCCYMVEKVGLLVIQLL